MMFKNFFVTFDSSYHLLIPNHIYPRLIWLFRGSIITCSIWGILHNVDPLIRNFRTSIVSRSGFSRVKYSLVKTGDSYVSWVSSNWRTGSSVQVLSSGTDVSAINFSRLNTIHVVFIIQSPSQWEERFLHVDPIWGHSSKPCSNKNIKNSAFAEVCLLCKLLERLLEPRHVRIRSDVLQLLLSHVSLQSSHKNIHFVKFVFSSLECYERFIIIEIAVWLVSENETVYRSTQLVSILLSKEKPKFM